MWKFGSLRTLTGIVQTVKSSVVTIGKVQNSWKIARSHPSGSALVHIDRSNVDALLSKYDTLLLDCDGVLWDTDHVTQFPGVAEAIHKLRSNSKKLLFVSNNSMHSRESYCAKFTNFLGLHVEEKDMFTVTHAAALYLKHVLKVTRKCYVIGGQGTAKELEMEGIAYIGIGPDTDPISGDPKELLKQHLDPDVEAVLVAFDVHFNYNKLYKATSYLMKESCHYVATNDIEASATIGPMNRQPVTGAIVAAVNFAGRRKPLTIGKPHKHLMECIRTEHPDIVLERTLMVGDAMKTDIAFAHETGIDSLLVLTGVSTMADVKRAQQSASHQFIPNYIMDKFSHIAPAE